MSFSTIAFIATAATVVSAEYTNTWWTPSSESVWTPSTSAVESVWTPSSESVWTPSSSTAEAWAPSSVPGKVSVYTSYTNTVYVTKATTSTTTVDCGKGTMIYGNGSAPAFTPSLGSPSNMPTDLPSDWSKHIPSSVLPPQVSGATGGIVTTNCANASLTYTFTYTPSGSKPKKTSSLVETPAAPTDEPSQPSPPTEVTEVPAIPAPGSDSEGADSSSGSNSGKGRPSHGFSNGDMDSAGSRQDVTTIGAIFTLCAVAVVACML